MSQNGGLFLTAFRATTGGGCKTKEKAEKEDNLVQPTLQLECQNQHREQVPKEHFPPNHRYSKI